MYTEKTAKNHSDYWKDGCELEQSIIRDITIRKKLKQIDAHADRLNMVGEMAATVAHEIRNPMTTVRGYLQMLGNKKENMCNKVEFDLMIGELDRANDIIREYLFMAKDKAVKFERCYLNDIVNGLYASIQEEAKASNVSVKLELSDIIELDLDKREIKQLLINLVRNGIQAMPLGGSLTIGTTMISDGIVLSIKDQGMGIPMNILDNLGTPFLTTKDNGTGLGVPMCCRIASRHNAEIHVKTNCTGTTFFVRFKFSHSVMQVVRSSVMASVVVEN